MAEKDYQDRYLDGLQKQLEDLKDAILTLQEDVTDIKSKVVYMYGFAAGVGIIASFAIDWLRTTFMGH